MIFLETSSNAKDEAEDSMLLLLLSFFLFFWNRDKDREETGGTGDLLRAGRVGDERDDNARSALKSDVEVVLLWGDS
jgi:hypothetical protein